MISILTLTSCSVMQNMMMKKVAKMPQEDKMKMMSKMMGSSDSSSCSKMMEQMACMSGESTSITDMAKEMMPLCATDMVQNLNDAEKTDFMIGLTGGIILAGYDSLSANGKSGYKAVILGIICELD